MADRPAGFADVVALAEIIFIERTAPPVPGLEVPLPNNAVAPWPDQNTADLCNRRDRHPAIGCCSQAAGLEHQNPPAALRHGLGQHEAGDPAAGDAEVVRPASGRASARSTSTIIGDRPEVGTLQDPAVDDDETVVLGCWGRSPEPARQSEPSGSARAEKRASCGRWHSGGSPSRLPSVSRSRPALTRRRAAPPAAPMPQAASRLARPRRRASHGR